MLVSFKVFAENCVDFLFMADLSKSVKELEALSTYPEPEGFHARRLEALQAELKEASSSTAEQQAHIKQVANGVHIFLGTYRYVTQVFLNTPPVDHEARG